MSAQRVLHYDASQPLYGISFSNSTSHPFRTALSTITTGLSNKLCIVDLTSSPNASQSQSPYYSQHNGAPSNGAGPEFRPMAQTSLNVPATKVAWEPGESLRLDEGGRGELVASSGDVLHIWEVAEEWESGGGGYVGNTYGGASSWSLKNRSVLSNAKGAHGSSPPITSFSWNRKSPNKLVSCSIDTTATLWDINTSQAMTQLIAHDRAVYDLSWLPDSSDIFVSVGADGSLRAFDLRQLEHSTILYESANDAPLARIAFSQKEQHMLACFGLDDSKVLILDMRSPGKPVAELVGHQAPLGAIAWGATGPSSRSDTTGGGWLASCGDDSQLLLYDLTAPISSSRPSSRSNFKPPPANPSPYAALSPSATPASQRTPSPADAAEILPSKGWTARGEVNNLAFTSNGDWLGCVSGNRMSVLSV
ncbi:hypothetical protein IAR50_003344 [Cryptococcus sp. DSM 104548]